MRDKAAAAAKSDVMKGNKLGETRRQRQPKAKPCEIMKGDKLGRPGSSGSQERSHEGRQA